MKEKEPRFETEKEFKKTILSESEREMVRKKVEEEIRKLERSPKFISEAEEARLKIEKLRPSGKIEKLLELAKEKGIFFAIKVAQDTKDPHLLDTLHDLLAYKGYFKALLEKK